MTTSAEANFHLPVPPETTWLDPDDEVDSTQLPIRPDASFLAGGVSASAVLLVCLLAAAFWAGATYHTDARPEMDTRSAWAPTPVTTEPLMPALTAIIPAQANTPATPEAAAATAMLTSATSGSLYQLKKLARQYEGTPIDFNDPTSVAAERAARLSAGGQSSAGGVVDVKVDPGCTRWVVITTIFEPSYLIRQLAHSRDWCMVIVADKKGPDPASYREIADTMKARFVFLTPAAQSTLPYATRTALPWSHFGRKNLGYLFALSHGARVVYDTDDDNRLVYETIPYDQTINGRLHEAAGMSPVPGTPSDYYVWREDSEECLDPPHGGCVLSTSPGWFPRVGVFMTPDLAQSTTVRKGAPVVNPFPWYSKHRTGDVIASEVRWPRGFPLSEIMNPDTWASVYQSDQLGHAYDIFADRTRAMPAGVRLGVVQSLAQHDPDFDAISRLTQRLPHRFTEERGLLVLPAGVYSPYNAQATLHLPVAYWGMLLPITVHGRVSDIYRGYIAQRLMREVGVQLSFSDSWVVQIRNAHEYAKDFQSELPLYERIPALLELLDQWRVPAGLGDLRTSTTGAFASAQVDLFRSLYEYGFLEVDDVRLVESWWIDLLHAGYDLQRELAQDDVAAAHADQLAHMNGLDTHALLGPVIGTDASPSTWPELPPLPKAARSLTGWTHDNHQATMCDTFTTLVAQGHSAICASVRQRSVPAAVDIAHYPHVEYAADVRPLAPFIMEHSHSGVMIDETQVAAFFDYYKADATFAKADFVWCSFMPSACEQYMAFNKSIIWLAAHRFTMVRCRPGEMARIIEHVQMLAEARLKDPSAPTHIIGAQSMYDVAYMQYYTGLRPQVIEANALHYAWRTTRRAWSEDATPELVARRRTEILVGPLTLSPRHGVKGYNMIPDIRAAGPAARRQTPGLEEYAFESAKVIYDWFDLHQVANHRAAVLLPYAVMSLSITDLYALGLPIFVPSVAFLDQLGLVWDRTVSSGDPYCGGPDSDESKMPPQHPNSHFAYGPDQREDRRAVQYWLSMADYYTLPYITTFDSWTDLYLKLHQADFHRIHLLMMEQNERRFGRTTRTWHSATANIQKASTRQVPQGTLQDAMRALWGQERMMVY